MPIKERIIEREYNTEMPVKESTRREANAEKSGQQFVPSSREANKKRLMNNFVPL